MINMFPEVEVTQEEETEAFPWEEDQRGVSKEEEVAVSMKEGIDLGAGIEFVQFHSQKKSEREI